MNKKFEVLVCALAGMAFISLPMMGQERMSAERIAKEQAFPKKGVNPRTSESEQPDSVVMYDDAGYQANVLYYAAQGPRFYYFDYYKKWAISNDHFYVDLWPDAEYDVKYNSIGLVESMMYPDYGGNINDYRLVQFQYNANGYLTSEDSYVRPINSPTSPWVHIFQTTYFYDSYENWVGYQTYYLKGTVPKISYPTYSARVDSKGRIVYSEYNMGPDGWTTINGRHSKFKYYIWYYSDGQASSASVTNSVPVGSDNKGGFDVTVNIPTDSIASGSFTVNLPEGFTLDEKNTQLSVNLNNFNLTVTPQDNNSWIFEFNPKTARSMTDWAEDAANSLAHIAYTVDNTINDSIYNITVESILLETPGANNIPLPAITVPVQVNRVNTGIASAGNNHVYVSGNNLFIRSGNTCNITVYTVSGQLFKQQTIGAGETIIPLPAGTYLVKAGETVNKIIIIR